MASPKYPKTFHLPWSTGITNEDKVATSIDRLIGMPIVLTEKIDGSNCSLESDGCFARTHAHAPTHASFDLLKSLHASIKHKIPDDIQLFGENVFARHSIAYDALPAYFLLFGVAIYPKSRSNNKIHTPGRVWFSWDMVEMWAEDIGVPTVPVLFKGQVSSEKELQDLTESFMVKPSCYGGVREGVVVRFAGAFKEMELDCVLKCVRANHVQTDVHWKDQEIIRNKLKV